MDYKDAGVDIEAADSLVDWLKSQSSDEPHRNLKVSGIGGFASLFRVPIDQYKKPLLVSCTDGVGTKLKLAFDCKSYIGIGQDLVAMCVNDLVTLGAQPLFFLDYFSTGRLNLDQAKEFLSGVKAACLESDCLLIGGETAEMPGFYPSGEFDCAGFSVGIVEEAEAWGAHLVQSEDCVVGVSSSGFHSNGYSLLRKLFEKDMKDYSQELMTPTRLYPKLVNSVKKIGIHSSAHITGGGIENLGRVIPDGMGVDLKNWDFPEIYKEVEKRSGLTKLELMKTFNCGIGFAFILPQNKVSLLKEEITKHGYRAIDLGKIQESQKKIIYPSEVN